MDISPDWTEKERLAAIQAIVENVIGQVSPGVRIELINVLFLCYKDAAWLELNRRRILSNAGKEK